LLDIARKPIGMVMIQEIARTMRYYKMNDFQLHLSDNYIFLENYGKYGTENEAFKAYEAFRLESGLTNAAGESPTATDYSISKAEMQWFIQYERKFGMNIVPEIDMPAHATSFTKIWPELMVQNKVSPLNSNRPLIDHLDVSKPEAVAKIKELFDDYTKGENPTFDSETIVHIGADEFVDNYTAYRQFVNEIVPYVKETNTVRMWGGLTWINDGKTEIVKEAIENVEMNLWSSDWADGKQMYDMGYKLINTIDDFGYMVPNGSMNRANSYGDLLNVSRIFNEFAANRVKTRNGYINLPSGDDQVLGAAYAIWSDNIDKHSNGLTESDLYYRFFDALPFYAEKTWAATGKEKGSAEALLALAQDIGTAPRTDPYDQPVSYGTVHASYDFENGLKDSTKNQRTRMASGAAVVDGALELKGGKSYAMSMFLDKVGNGNELIFDITLTEAAKPGDILFETTPEYGTHDIRIMENGKLGFTRELHNYYFDYEIPVGETVEIRIYAEQQVTYLYVNGELIGTATGKFIHNGIEKKTGITNATFAIPVERIGSETNAIKATIDNVVIRKNTDIKPDNAEFDYPVDKITYKTGSQQPQSGSEGPVSLAFDGNTNTYWHSEWTPSWSSSQLENYLWVEFKLEEATMVDAIRYLPRPGGGNGDITGYRVEGTTDGTTWTTLATGTWERSGQTWKLAEFEATEVTGLRLVATSTYADSGNNKFASAAELRVRTAVEETPEVTPTPEVTEAPKPTETPEATESVTKVFTDVYADWYASYVQYVYDNGLMTGIKGTTEFQPNANITKAQVAQVLYNMVQQPAPENKNVFTDLTDVYEGEWYANAVAWAYATGVVTGDLNAKKFFPNADVTREQLALMMYRYADYKKYDVTANSDLAGLKNAENVSNWAASGVKWAVGAGLISGIEKDGVKDLAPQGNASRAQMAAILQRFCEADK
jgi:hexosaminidase